MENQIFKRNDNGEVELIDTVILEVPTQEEIIAEKEAELLAMYKELQELKNNI